MKETEFEVLDELYFVISFEELLSAVELDEEELLEVLIELARKEWIRIYDSSDNELDKYNLRESYHSYFYLASKKGLFAHNS